MVEQALIRAALFDEVKDKLKESAFALSGGQQQRLCIARCLAVGPEVILMDEPCSALDPIATARIEDLMADLKQQYTIVIVTHNMQQAARVSDMTAFMTAEVDADARRVGKLVEYDVTEKIFTNPMTPAPRATSPDGSGERGVDEAQLNVLLLVAAIAGWCVAALAIVRWTARLAGVAGGARRARRSRTSCRSKSRWSKRSRMPTNGSAWPRRRSTGWSARSTSRQTGSWSLIGSDGKCSGTPPRTTSEARDTVTSSRKTRSPR